MRYIECASAGGPEVLQLAEGELPEPGPGQVLIQVAASGINRADTLQRAGFYPPPPGASPILGLEVSGTIVERGAGVGSWAVGDSVCALLGGGGYAEYAVAEAAECLPVPAGMSLVEAACLPETLLTVWSNVIDRARLEPGERFLVHGGSSGIGTMAIQLLKHYGAVVYATAGSDAKVELCHRLGADLAVNYRNEDFVEAFAAASEGAGVDVILDMVGGDYVSRNMTLAATEGRIVNIAYMQGSRVELDLLLVMLKRLSLMGSTLRAREPAFKAALTETVRDRVWPWLEQGLIKPQVHATFSPEEAAACHQLMESSQHMGQLVITW